jgi:uncharacterized phage infection (PIP) family protein YhgE
MNDIIIETVVEKINAHENRLNDQQKSAQAMNETISTLKSESEQVHKMISTINELQAGLARLNLPVSEMEKLKSTIALNNHLLQNPTQQKIIHVHTGGKMLWSLIGATVLIILLVIGWINTWGSLKQYRMHDMCWRYLKIHLDTKQLQSLQNIERQYQQDADEMTGMVEQQELIIKQRTEVQLRSDTVSNDRQRDINKRPLGGQKRKRNN